jgi:hypothetical protein
MDAQQILGQFKTICTRIHTAMPSTYRWQWDTRFSVAMIVIERRDMPVILGSISKEFNGQWNDANIDSAPEAVMNVVNDTFGIQPGQILFNSDDQQDMVLLAAWWPWGNGVNVSLRIGLFETKDHTITPADAENHLRDWFQLH